jgi:hypothetical protein
MYVSVITILNLVFFTWAHDFHVSRVQVYYNAEERIIEVSANIFIDDLEKALSVYSADKLSLGTTSEDVESDELIANYLREKMKVYNGVMKLTPVWLGKEVTEDLSAFWIHFYYEWDGTGSLILHNNVLTELYDDQQNIIESMIGSKREFLLLTKSRTKGVLN